MSTPFIGQLMAVAFNFAPKSWAFTNGQVMSIAQNQALFSLLGTTYGGNGQTTFSLPNLQSRVTVSSGQGPGLSTYTLGQTGGEENHTLLSSEIPTHTHVMSATAAAGSLGAPAGNVFANSPMYVKGNGDSQPIAGFTGSAGGNQPHANIQPYLVINWCIALQGIFPSRN
jgi:microcystin-dependent protein